MPERVQQFVVTLLQENLNTLNMATYTQILYHIVFSTKNRECVLLIDFREKLYRFIWGVIKNNKCVLYQINGVEDHLHIATHLHPTKNLANLVKDIKVSSSLMIKNENIFPGFTGWQEGYSAFTKSNAEKDILINYIKKQDEHHRRVSFREELIELLKEEGIDFKEECLL
jgi:REP element-mobilizing transposase RayT